MTDISGMWKCVTTYDTRILVTPKKLAVDCLALDQIFQPYERFFGVWLGWAAKV